MRKISFAEISVFVVNRIFNWRFWIAGLTQKSGIAKKVIDKMLFEKDEIIVIPNTINVNRKIEAEKSEFLPTEVIKDVIRRCDDIVIMDSCLCRTSTNCEDYPQDIGCIFLGPTTKKIPRKLCHEATVDEALAQVDEADAAGLSHIIGRNKIDTVWMNVRPGEGLLTICHCCPCCCLWKVYPNLHNDISDKLERLDGVRVNFDGDKCRHCRKCLDACMFKIIKEKDGRIILNSDKCKGCGLCVNSCKFGALTIDYTDETIDNVVNRMENLIEYE